MVTQWVRTAALVLAVILSAVVSGAGCDSEGRSNARSVREIRKAVKEALTYVEHRRGSSINFLSIPLEAGTTIVPLDFLQRDGLASVALEEKSYLFFIDEHPGTDNAGAGLLVTFPVNDPTAAVIRFHHWHASCFTMFRRDGNRIVVGDKWLKYSGHAFARVLVALIAATMVVALWLACRLTSYSSPP